MENRENVIPAGNDRLPARHLRLGAIAAWPITLPWRAARSFHPVSVPTLARRSYRIELVTTLFFAVTLAVIEGGVIGVFTKQTYFGVVSPGRLNLIVALVGAAPDFANILSFLVVTLSVGRRKVPLINTLQLATVALVGAITVIPESAAGLFVLLAVVVAARVCWSGIITMRPTIWKANYPPRDRARIIGKFSTVQQATVAVVGFGLGAALDSARGWAPLVMSLAAGLGLVAVWTTSRQRVRRERTSLDAERTAVGVLKPWHGPLVVWRVLRQDAQYAKFMIAMFILGLGNLMLTPMLVIVLKEQFGFGYLGSILITTTIPCLVMPWAVPLWARLLDRAHVVRFRSIHGWTFVFATIFFMLGTWLHRAELMYAAAAVQGVALGGGALAWNLGHVDFAPPSQVSQYMATHVTLNGIRGLTAPLLAVFLYEWLGRHGLTRPHAAAAVLGLSTVLCVVGTAGFVALRLAMGQAARVSRR